MNRLTERLPNGVIKRSAVMGETPIARLAAYEDNGQTPEEQAEMIAENERLREELEAIARQINGAKACKMCVHQDYAPIDGPCAKCHRPHKSHFEWERPRAENGGIK